MAFVEAGAHVVCAARGPKRLQMTVYDDYRRLVWRAGNR